MTRHEDSRSKLAPVENREHRYSRKNGGILDIYTPQAARCPVCHALVLVGHSFADHVFWCKRPEIARHE